VNTAVCAGARMSHRITALEGYRELDARVGADGNGQVLETYVQLGDGGELVGKLLADMANMREESIVTAGEQSNMHEGRVCLCNVIV